MVALVGYTNAGKSTLFNRMTGAEVLAKDMLFATLDPTMRGVALPSGRKIILSDTVGFISDLPTQLVAAFRATLEEVLEADLILHVRDISHPETAEQAADVADILTSPWGQRGDTAVRGLEQAGSGRPVGSARRCWRKPRQRAGVFAVSALTGEGLPRSAGRDFAGFEEEKTDAALTSAVSRRPHAAPGCMSEGVVLAEVQDEDGWRIDRALDGAAGKTLARRGRLTAGRLPNLANQRQIDAESHHSSRHCRVRSARCGFVKAQPGQQAQTRRRCADRPRRSGLHSVMRGKQMSDHAPSSPRAPDPLPQ